MRIDQLHKPLKYKDLYSAEISAISLSKGDLDWSYKVVREGEIYMIEIEDKETQDFIGYF